MQHKVTIRFMTVDEVDDAELIARDLAKRVEMLAERTPVETGELRLLVREASTEAMAEAHA